MAGSVFTGGVEPYPAGRRAPAPRPSRAQVVTVRLLLLAASFALACGITVVSAALDTEVVHDDAELESIDLGVPFDWLASTTEADPPYPYRMGMSDPMNYSQRGRAGPFLADVAVWWLLEFLVVAGYLAYLAARAAPWRRRGSGG